MNRIGENIMPIDGAPVVQYTRGTMRNCLTEVSFSYEYLTLTQSTSVKVSLAMLSTNHGGCSSTSLKLYPSLTSAQISAAALRPEFVPAFVFCKVEQEPIYVFDMTATTTVSRNYMALYIAVQQLLLDSLHLTCLGT